VLAFARPSAPRVLLEGLPVSYAAGDLTEPGSVGRAIRGCDAVIHCAADYRIWVPDPDAMRAVNVDGTRAVMRAVLAEGCRRVVHVSSVATLKPRSDGLPATEADAAAPDEAIGPYKQARRKPNGWWRTWPRAPACRR
jgi:dihydroflavonol-4-reductase